MKLSKTQLMEVVNRIKMIAYLVRQMPAIPETESHGNRFEAWQYADALAIHGITFDSSSNGSDLFLWLQKESGLKAVHLLLVSEFSEQQFNDCIDRIEETARKHRNGVEYVHIGGNWDESLTEWQAIS